MRPESASITSTASMRKAGLLVAVLSSFFTPFMGSAVNIALPSIASEFHLSAVALSWVATSFLLAAAVFIVPFGRLADIHGRRKLFILGLFIFTISCLAIALSPSGAWLIVSRVFQGIGSAILSGTAMAILTSVYPANERGKALGFQVASVYLGLSLGPSLGGVLTHYLGWRSIFWVGLPLGIITIIVTFWKLRGEWSEAKGEKFDVTGSIIYGVALVALMLGLSELPAMIGVWLLIAGVIGITLFIMLELKILSPVLNINLFRQNAVLAFANLAALINYSATSAISFLLSLYLQYLKDFSAQVAGLVLIIQPVMMTLVSLFAGRLSDRTEPRLLASIGMAITTAGLIMLIFVDANTNLAFIIMILVIQGIGFGLFSSPNSNAVMSAVERRYYGVASGMLGTMRLIGQMLSLGIATLLFSLYMGQVQITPEFYPLFLDSAHTGFIIFAVLCFLGVFASLTRRKPVAGR